MHRVESTQQAALLSCSDATPAVYAVVAQVFAHLSGRQMDTVVGQSPGRRADALRPHRNGPSLRRGGPSRARLSWEANIDHIKSRVLLEMRGSTIKDSGCYVMAGVSPKCVVSSRQPKSRLAALETTKRLQLLS